MPQAASIVAYLYLSAFVCAHLWLDEPAVKWVYEPMYNISDTAISHSGQSSKRTCNTIPDCIVFRSQLLSCAVYYRLRQQFATKIVARSL